MFTNSGLDTKRFKSDGVGTFKSGLEKVYSAKEPTDLFVLRNHNGMEVCITNFGARIVSIIVPDKNGEPTDVVLGFDNIKDYCDFDNNPTFFGAAVGRFANRISGGKFQIDGKDYSVPPTEAGNCLHGGIYNWAFQTFSVSRYDEMSNLLDLQLISPDGDCGFNGEVIFNVTYFLDQDNTLHCYYNATANRPTVINVTNHSYFNLTGNAGDVLKHKLWINSNWCTPLKEGTIPNGEIRRIPDGSPLDFYTEKEVGKDISDEDNEQIKLGHGYDHNFVLGISAQHGEAAATLTNPENGIKLVVFTQEPGIQLFEWDNKGKPVIGKHGIEYKGDCAVCLEAQNFPDAPNIPHFKSSVLRPGTLYKSRTKYTFTIEE